MKIATRGILLGLLAVPMALQAQTLLGGLGNFDAANYSGYDAHGFELQFEGLNAGDIYYTWSGNRYGAPSVIPYATGVYVRWTSSYAGGQWLGTTVQHPTGGGTFQGTCYMGYAGYNTAGCEHFGTTLRANPTLVTAHWMVEDPAVPGTLVVTGVPIPVNLPIYIINPPVTPTAPPVLAARIVPVRPPRPEVMFGDATWVKIFKTEIDREVTLDELVDTNPVVPQDPTQIETAWKLLQHNPHSANSGALVNQGGMNSSSHSVIRRIETYAYTGAYDPVDHGAVCIDPLCSAPQAGELGDLIVAQMTAANVGIPSVTVTKTGNGTVTGVLGKINCGGSCTTPVALGTAVSLTASPGGTFFSGWGGACSGAALTCNLTVNDAMSVSATFTPVFTLSIGRGGSGTVVGTPGGVFNTQINCGGNCSAKFTQGTTVTLTATPAPGLSFVNWTNGCSGTTPTCTVTIGKDTTVQANFK